MPADGSERPRWAEASATTLENEHVALRPVSAADRAALHAIAMDPQIWQYFVSRVDTDEQFEAFFDAMIADHAERRRAVFCVHDKASSRLCGSMSFGNMSPADQRLEIGWSWLGADFRGHGINRWAKYLLLEHAFEVLGAERVEFKTDELNERARRALRAIGAAEEGTLRSFNPMPGGRRRNAVFYSVLRQEWPEVKRHLAESEPTSVAR
jgi:RimJ/RimL family protein N-acetyltransferase